MTTYFHKVLTHNYINKIKLS